MLRQRREYEVVGLLTTFNGEADRVAMHAVRRELVERQAAAAGLPLWDVALPWPCSNEQYELLALVHGRLRRGSPAWRLGICFLRMCGLIGRSR